VYSSFDGEKQFFEVRAKQHGAREDERFEPTKTDVE
jgi:hypothetical protein